MSAECSCNGTIGNLRTPNCPPQIGKILRVNFQSLYQTDGTANFLDTTVTLNKAFWDALQYHADTSIRIYPLPEDMEDVTAPKEDSVFKTYGSGRRIKIRQGARNFTGTIPESAAPLVDKINSRGCSKQGVYFHTSIGILGWLKEKGKLYPIPLSQASLDAVLNLQDETDPQRTMLMLQWDNQVSDGELAIIPYTKITGIDMFREFQGKMDTTIEQVAANRSTTTFRVKISTSYGDAVDAEPVPDLETADFSVYNVTDATSETLTSATEVTGETGTYDFVLSGAETATDILRLSLNSTANTKPFAFDSWAAVEIALQ